MLTLLLINEFCFVQIDPETGCTTPTPSSYNLTAILLNEGMNDLKALGQ